jgi:hypothetical protein
MAGVTNGPQPLCHQYLPQVSFITIPLFLCTHSAIKENNFHSFKPTVPHESLLLTSLVLNLLPFPSFIPCYQTFYDVSSHHTLKNRNHLPRPLVSPCLSSTFSSIKLTVPRSTTDPLQEHHAWNKYTR